MSINDKGREASARSVQIPASGISLPGDLAIPAGAGGVVLFAHGSGSSRNSPRNKFVARTIQASGIATLLFDLLSPAEDREDAVDGHLRFDIDLLATRLANAARWINEQPETRHLGVGCFGASTGGAAALVAAAELGPLVQAVVSRGGRPDLAGDALPRVSSPTLLIVGERDHHVLQLNRAAYAQLRCQKRLVLVPGATHLFEEPGALEEVAALATEWFGRNLRPR
jgi:dienelactone hydrolase